jgi:hypothetical protein
MRTIQSTVQRDVPRGLLIGLAGFLALVPHDAHAVQIGVATDGIPWFLNGFSAIMTVETAAVSPWRFSVEAWGMDLPDTVVERMEMNADEGWRQRIDLAVGLYADRHLGESGRWHLGGTVHTMSSTITRAGSSQSRDLLTLEVLARGGYRWFPLTEQGLFINPWLGAGPLVALTPPEPIAGEAYATARAQVIGTVHVGWRF